MLGSAPGEDDVSGTITVPEIAHDTEEDEYVVRELPSAPCLRAFVELNMLRSS